MTGMVWGGEEPENGGEWTLPDEGRHEMRVMSARETESKNGNPMLVLGCCGDDWEVREFLVNNPKMAWKNNKVLRGLGLDPLTPLEPDDFIGIDFAADLFHREYNDKTYAAINWDTATPMSTAEKKDDSFGADAPF